MTWAGAESRKISLHRPAECRTKYPPAAPEAEIPRKVPGCGAGLAEASALESPEEAETERLLSLKSRLPVSKEPV